MYEENFNILIVDDEKSNLDVLRHILQPKYNVLIAKSGFAALDIAAETMPDLILLDVIMPDMDGFEVLTELKKSEPTASIPIIFITGLNDVENEERGFFLGAVDYITKPFHTSIVKARVDTHIKIVRQMRMIERLGLIDSLTEIPNRRSFDNHIEIEFRRLKREQLPLGFLMIDVDNFKNFNDTYGHQQGDILLQNLAKVFLSTLKRSTDFVFRWGGEEFAIILANTDLSGTMEIAESIRINAQSMKIKCERNNEPIGITVSIGAYSDIPTEDISIHDFISKADEALYRAKQTGRNKVVHNDMIRRLDK